MTQHLQYDYLRKQLQEITSSYSNTFQQAEIIAQQITLVEASPGDHTLFPKLTNAIFWSHVCRRVAVDPQNLNTRILHIEISHLYGTTTIQNVVMYLLFTRLSVVRIFKGYFMNQQQQLGRLPIMALDNTNIFSKSCRWYQELPAFVSLDPLYNSVRPIYDADSANTEYEHVDNYENASAHPFKYLRVSYRLLQVASSLPDFQIKLWSLIPQGNHSIVHVSLSGIPALHHLFKKIHANYLPIPDSCIRSGVFIPQIDF
ncbi:hypothetical protein BD560DRAFT_437574 [Blakeslea trispora]|nr:hypothetical protein BD560DRAFT_437574 [Blakeslea trispora]